MLDDVARDRSRDNAYARAHGSGKARHGDRVTSSIPRELFENYASLSRARGNFGTARGCGCVVDGLGVNDARAGGGRGRGGERSEGNCVEGCGGVSAAFINARGVGSSRARRGCGCG